MAQRTVHYLLGEMLIDCGVKDVDRFRIGNLLPDAIESTAFRDLTHYTKSELIDGKTRKYSDFEAFRREFAPLVESDGLYLGYYLHLVEDACCRVQWDELGILGRIRDFDDVRRLHRDYHILNGYIVRRWGIEDSLVMPEGFENEPVTRIYPFLLTDFLTEMRGDFDDPARGETVFVTERTIDSFVEDYLDICRDALRRILTGAEPLDPKTLCWKPHVAT